MDSPFPSPSALNGGVNEINTMPPPQDVSWDPQKSLDSSRQLATQIHGLTATLTQLQRNQIVACKQRIQYSHQSLREAEIEVQEAKAGRSDAEAAHTACKELLRQEREAHTHTKAYMSAKAAEVEEKTREDRQGALHLEILKSAKLSRECESNGRWRIELEQKKDRQIAAIVEKHEQEKSKLQQDILKLQFDLYGALKKVEGTMQTQVKNEKDDVAVKDEREVDQEELRTKRGTLRGNKRKRRQ